MAEKYKLQVSLSLKDRISKPLKDVRNKISSFDRSLRSVGRAAGDFAGFLGKPLALLAGSGLFSIKSAVSTFTQLGDSIDKAAQRAGVGVIELQRLQYAAGLGGSSAEAMEGALTKLGQQMNLAAGGGAKEFGALLQHLGIPLKDANGKMRSSAAVLRELAEAMKNNEDPAARLQIATLAFGKAGSGMIPVLSGGAKALDAMGDRAEKLGLILDKETIDKAAKLNDQLGELKQLGQVTSAKIGAQLAPALEKIIPQIETIINDNRDLIAQGLASLIDGISTAIEQIDWQALSSGIKDGIDWFKKLVDMLGGVEGIITGAGIIIKTMLVSKLFAVGKAVFDAMKALKLLGGALKVFAMSNPFTAILLALGAMYVYWDDIKGILGWCWEKIRDIGRALLNTPLGKIVGKVLGVDVNVPPGAGKQTVDSNLTVSVAAEKGSTAQVQSASSTGGNLVVNYSVD